MKKNKKKKVKLSKFGRAFYAFTIIFAISAPLLIVFSKATLSEINYKVEIAKKEIVAQKKQNESLTMKINELASLDKIQDVADKQGLRYNNDNIKIINEE